MTTLRECADTAAAALVEMLRSAKDALDAAAVADVIEQVLNQATSETEEGAQRRLVDLQDLMQERLRRLLDASPAVIYSFKAKEDFAPIFVSNNIATPFGYAPRDYLDDGNVAEEQTPIKVKGFAEPIRCYKVQGLYDQLAEEGTVIREEQE